MMRKPAHLRLETEPSFVKKEHQSVRIVQVLLDDLSRFFYRPREAFHPPWHVLVEALSIEIPFP